MEHALESVRSSIYSPFCTVASKLGGAHNFATCESACMNTPHRSHGYGKIIMEPAGEEIPRPAPCSNGVNLLDETTTSHLHRNNVQEA